MAFDAGDIQARATLDTRPFMASAAKVRAEGRKLAREKWNARVGIDTSPADRESDQFKTRLQTKFSRPTTARITADSTDALLKIKPLTDKLDEIQRKVATARVRLDGDARAKQQLDQLDLQLRRVGLITSRPRVSLGGIDTANLRLDELETKLALVGRSRVSPGGGGGGILGSLSNLGSHGPGGLGLAIGAGLPLIAPVAGLAAGAASSLLTPTVAAGIGGGLFAKTAASTYQQVSKDLKNLISLQAKYNAATSNKTRATALAAEKKAWGALSPAEQKAVDTMQSLHDEWTKFQKDLHPQTFKLLSTGADIAAKGLKLLEPDVKAAGKAINSLASGADKALNDPFWQQFFGTFLPGQTHSALTVLGTDLGNVGTGLAHLTERFAPLGKDLENASVRWTSQFNKWTQGDGPGRFVDWVEKNGPTAAHDLEDIGKGIGGVLKSLAPLGQLELAAFGPILKFIGGFAQQHPKEVEALGAAYLSVAVGLKAISAVSGIAGTAEAVGALFKALRSGKGIGGVKDVLKGGSGIGGCCCGPGGGGGVPGTVERDAESGGAGYGAAKLLGKAGISVGSAADLVTAIAPFATIAAAKWLGDQGIQDKYNGFAQPPSSSNTSGVYSGIPKDFVSQFPIAAALTSTLFPVNRTIAAQGATAGNSPSGYSLSKLVGNVVNKGTPAEIATLAHLAKVYPQVAAAVRQVTGAQKALDAVTGRTDRRLGAIVTTGRSVRFEFGALADVADRVGSKSLTGISSAARANRQTLGDAASTLKDYRQHLLDSGAPLDEVKKKVDAAATSLEHQATKVYGDKAAVDKLLGSMHALPKQIISTIKVHTTGDKASEAALRRLLALRQSLAGDIVLHTVTSQTGRNVDYLTRHKAGGGMIHGPGTATSDSVPAWLSNGEFVMRASAVRHFGAATLARMNRYGNGGPVIYNPGGQNPSPNAPTSSSSSSGSSSTPSSRRAAAAHRAAVARASANAIAGIVDFAGLTFLDDLKSTEHAIRSGIGQMINRLDNAVRDKYLKTDKSLVKQLRGTRGLLVAIAQQETIVGKALNNAQQNLSNLRSQASSVRSGTLSAYQGLGDTSQLTNVTSVRGILSVEGQQAKVARAFTHNLGLLRKKGLSKQQYGELLAAGPGQAGNVVGLLAHATASQIRHLNADTGLFTSLGRQVGSTSAQYLFGSQIGRAQHQVQVDRRLQRDLLHDQRRVANALEQFLTAGLQDKGTHRALKQLTTVVGALPTADEIGKAVAGALNGHAKAAAINHRTHVPGVRRSG